MYEIYSKLTIKTPERREWRRSGVFIVVSEQISHIVLVFPLLTLNSSSRFLILLCIASNICDAFRDLVLFAQFKKTWKTTMEEEYL